MRARSKASSASSTDRKNDIEIYRIINQSACRMNRQDRIPYVSNVGSGCMTHGLNVLGMYTRCTLSHQNEKQSEQFSKDAKSGEVACLIFCSCRMKSSCLYFNLFPRACELSHKFKKKDP